MSFSRHPARRISGALAIGAVLAVTAFSAAAQEEIVVTHNQGETVLAGVPETVLTFELASLSTLHTLGVPVAGVPEFAMPEWLSQYTGDDYIKVGSLFEPDYETVAAAEADLVIVAGRSAAVYPQLSEIAPTIDLTVDNSNFLASQQRNAETLGQIFGLEAEVAAAWENIETQLAAVRAQTAEAGTALIVMVNGGELNAYGLGSRFGWIHADLGFTPVIENIEEATHGEAISSEFILEANPDWLIVLDRDAAVGEQGAGAAAVLDNELVAQTTAWSNDQVIYIDPIDWYIVAGGLGTIENMIDDIASGLGGAEGAEPTATPYAVTNEAGEIVVAHNQGETVLAGVPETVLTFELASLSTLHTLGVPVAGVPEFAMPEWLSQYTGDDYIKVGSLFEPDYETVAAAEADLVIVAGRSAAVYPQLSEIAPTIDLTVDNSNFLASQQRNAETLGQIFGLEAEVAAAWENIETQLAAVRAQTAEAGTALIVMVNGGELNAYGLGSRFGWIHADLGFTPVIENIEEATHGEAISSEFILEANPDWLIVLDRDAAVGEQGAGAAAVLDNELVAQTTAWSNGQVIYIDPIDWYIVAGGLGTVENMIEDIAVGLGS